MRDRRARSILVVDDSASVRAALESLLEPYGFEVEQAADGAAALRLCEAGRHALVLLDLHMPVLDGPTLLRMLRQRGNQVPVVLVTSAADTRLLSSVIKLGGTDYVSKPFDPAQIHAALVRVLGLDPGALVAETPRALVFDRDGASATLVAGAVPAHVAVDRAATPEAAEALARQRGYRLVLVDGVGGGREAADALGARLQALQPEAGLFLLDDPDRTSDARRRIPTGPFDGAVARPPEARVVREFLYPTCLRNLVLTGGDTLTVAAFRGHEEDVEVYFAVVARRLVAAIRTTLQTATSLRVDLCRAPDQPERIGGLVTAAMQDADDLDVEPTFVVTPAMKAGLDASGLRWPAELVTPGP